MEQEPKPSIFPPIEAYESDEELKRRREFLLDAISKLQNYMSGDEDKIVKESKLAELKELGEELESLHVTRQYLDQFTGANGSFTESARQDPKLVLDWISYDVLNVIKKIPSAIGASDALGQVGEFSEIENVSENAQMGMLNSEEMSPKLVDFAATQQALSFYQHVLGEN